VGRSIIEIILLGSRVVGRAFAAALREEYAASQQAAKNRQQSSSSSGGDSDQSGTASAISGLSLKEAMQILHVENLEDKSRIQHQYDHLFGVNDRKKGGSFYLQAKVFRAKERIDQEIGQQTVDPTYSQRMPVVQIEKAALCQCLNRKDFTDEEVDELCFEFGLELDEVTSEREMLAKEQGDAKAAQMGDQLSDAVIYKIEVPANRYDLLCVEGLSRALMVFQSLAQPPLYKAVQPAAGMQQMRVAPSTAQIRPYVVCAMLRNLSFTPASYKSFIDLQDKLHQTICRQRSLVAIGTHDFDTLTGPFLYEALPPSDIVFKPLNQTKEFSAVELMQLYSGESHLKAYLPIIRDSPVYPVIKDANGVVLSMPPIINGDHSKITLNTKNVFIEATATDAHKASVVLDTLVCAFSQYCSEQFTVEAVQVNYPDGRASIYPSLAYRQVDIQVDYLRKGVGRSDSQLTIDEICNRLTRMCLVAKATSDATVSVTVPPTRHDVLHPCDVLEDLAIAIGYNNLEMSLPPTLCTGKQQPLNSLTDKLRLEVAFAGFTECLTFALCSEKDISERLRLPLDSLPAVRIANPKTLEFQVARTSLLPGILKTVHSNRSLPLPLKLFEIQDVVYKSTDSSGSAVNSRQLAAVYYGKSSGFELIHGLMDRIMQVLGVPVDQYKLSATEVATYFTGRCANVLYKGSPVGTIGVLHPETLAQFDLTLPASAFVFDVE
uniref:Phenylalanine--tRNA ligase beta subunit n=1 Tax=Macrostomum lignano TaxID=282301 RepID=A0A1I8FZY8_9PLAT